MKRKDPELYSADIDWFLNAASSALGFRGTTSAVIACVERGGGASSADPEWVCDEMLGWGNHTRSAPARYRELSRVWRATPSWARGLLEIHYATRSDWPRGVQGQLGQLAGVAMALCLPDELGRLLRACESGRHQDLTRARGAAERAVRAAHGAFYEARQVGAEEWVVGA